ncbi:MAG: SDR family NAD(P)-dependent oxidoreductase, partial [Pirellulaceae bacterium]
MPASPDESRHIVITGVSRGLGRALVSGMIAGGHRVSGCARSVQSIDDLQNEFPGSHHFAALDVSQADQVESWAQEVIENQGPPDLLLNNAATINRNAPLWEVPPE